MFWLHTLLSAPAEDITVDQHDKNIDHGSIQRNPHTTYSAFALSGPFIMEASTASAGLQ